MDLRYTPDQLRALIRAKGWTGRALADYWHVTPIYLSRRINDQQRPQFWNDAFNGLPAAEGLGQALANRQAAAEELISLQTPHRKRGPKPGGRARVLDDREMESSFGLPGYRYRKYLTVGAIVTTLAELGADIEDGARGIVYAVDDTGVGERYGVIFESGATDWFLPDRVDAFLAESGLDAPGMQGYQYTSKRVLKSDFNAGRFNFWP